MSNHTTIRLQHVSLKTERENPMKKTALLASFVAIVFTLVGPATVLAADPAGIASQRRPSLVDRRVNSSDVVRWLHASAPVAGD